MRIFTGTINNHPTTVHLATPQDQQYIEHLSRLHSNNIGFVPKTAIADRIQRHDYHVLTINGQHAGFTLHGGGTRTTFRLCQVAIDEQLWRNGFGHIMTKLALLRASTRQHPNMIVTCRKGITMNNLVLDSGAHLINTNTTPTARGKPKLTYQWNNPYKHSPGDHAQRPLKRAPDDAR